MYMVDRKIWQTCLFSACITLTWVVSANIAVKGTWTEITAYGVGALFANIAAIKFVRRDNVSSKPS